MSKRLDLKEIELMEEFSAFLPFPQLDEQLLHLEPLTSAEPSVPEGYEAILQNCVEDSNDNITTIDTEGFLRPYNMDRDGKSLAGNWQLSSGKKDSARADNKKKVQRGRGRGRGRPAVKKSWVEKRDEANTRERRRMRDLVR